MRKVIREISLYKTLRFNFHYFKLKDAIRLPVIVSRHVLINNLRGQVRLECKVQPGGIRIGFRSVPVFDRFRSRTVLNVGGGTIIFKGRAVLGQGTRIGTGGILTFGENFQVTAETTIICDESITFGRDVLCSWQCQIMDTDFHQIIDNGEIKSNTSPINIGDHVWIGSRVIINKGTEIPANSVIASGSVVAGKFTEPDTLLAGVPATVKKKNINWK